MQVRRVPPGAEVTDRVHSITVVLDQDIRVDDVQPIVDAIRMLRGVIAAKPNVRDLGAYVAEQRVRVELRERLWKALEDPK